MKKIIYFILLILLFVSCSKKNDVIYFEENDSLSLDPTISWAVVVEPYVAFRDEPTWSSSVNEHCRYGDILMIRGCKILDSTTQKSSKETWYYFDKGWISEISINIYQNRYKAQKRAQELLK